MGLLTDFYNTVAKFFRPQEEVGEDASKSVATNRLKLVLMQDRTNLTPKILEQMRGELVDLLSKYLEMDKELLELNFEQEGDQVALMLSIPVIRAKDEEEIEKAIAETNAKKLEGSESDDEDSDEDIADSDKDEEDIEDDSAAETDEDEADEVESAIEEGSEEEYEEDSKIKTEAKKASKVSEKENTPEDATV